MQVINWLSDSPLHAFRALQDNPSDGMYVVPLSLDQFWLSGSPVAQLAVVFYVESGATQTIIIHMELFPDVAKNIDSDFLPNVLFAELHEKSGAAIIYPDRAQLLKPVAIPKPWGQEIWYTGIEARGVAGITDGKGVTPLPWLLAAFPEWYGVAAPVLLKILDPYADELLGDLYFELHQEKREVYVVTAIDSEAWPSGKGAIRFGFNQNVRREYSSDELFMQAYLKSVREYELLRRQIDKRLDEIRYAEKIPASEAVSPEVMRRWMSRIDNHLIEQELNARQNMNRFTHLKSLEIGDVVKVPTLLPHSLQHGVRTVEFQTPVYERMILSFAQKVLTQSHWDTERAASLMLLDEPVEIPPLCLAEGEGWRCEQVVDFADFVVERWLVESGTSIEFPASSTYRLIMMVDGELALDSCDLRNEQAALLPASLKTLKLSNNTANSWIFLLARPIL